MTTRAVAALSGSTILLVGPGWLGDAAARGLRAEGARVFTMSRSPVDTAQEALSGPDARWHVVGDIASAADDAGVRDALPARIDHVVVCVAPSRRAGDGYAIYPRATAGAAALARALEIPSVVYTSSTGVYAVDDGRVVTETTPVAPTTARVTALVDAEQQLLALDGHAVQILRVAGLYGPGRDPAARFATTEIAADHWCNMAWRDDVVAAVIHVLRTATIGEHRVFNCADGQPMLASAITKALGGTLQDSAAPPLPTGRSNQRVLVDALRESGWAPEVPTVLAGLRALGHAVREPVSE